MEKTVNFNIPLLVQNQAQKEYIVNEAFLIIETLIYATAISNTLSTPPTKNNNGDIYIVTKQNSGQEWKGNGDSIAFFYNGWRFIRPRKHMRFFISDTQETLIFDGKNWKTFN